LIRLAGMLCIEQNDCVSESAMSSARAMRLPVFLAA
jgi:hypothetical protein